MLHQWWRPLLPSSRPLQHYPISPGSHYCWIRSGAYSKVHFGVWNSHKQLLIEMYSSCEPGLYGTTWACWTLWWFAWSLYVSSVDRSMLLSNFKHMKVCWGEDRHSPQRHIFVCDCWQGVAQLGIPDFALVWMTPLCIILILFDKIQFYSSRIENRLLPPDINSCLHSWFFVVSQTLAPLSFLAPLSLWKLDPAGTKGFLTWFNFSLWNDCFPWRRLQVGMKEMMRNQIGSFWENLFMWCYDCSSCWAI